MATVKPKPATGDAPRPGVKQSAKSDGVLAPTATPALDALLLAEPDLIDRIFDFALKLMPEIAGKSVEIKQALRREFAGERAYIRRRDTSCADPIARKVLAVFNGRNATETARELGIGRATVYRKIKQAGGNRD